MGRDYPRLPHQPRDPSGQPVICAVIRFGEIGERLPPRQPEGAGYFPCFIKPLRNHLVRLLLSAVIIATTLFATAPPASADGPPVVFVHGRYVSGAETPPSYTARIEALYLAEGLDVHAIELWGSDNYTNAALIRSHVNALNVPKVNLVMHSMGGLSGRYYLKYMGGTAKVENAVFMGVPHYGVPTYCLAWWLYQLCPANPLLNPYTPGSLNYGDDTPGETHYQDLWSDGSPRLAPLDGGVACSLYIPGVAHNDEPFDPQFIAAMKTFLASGDC